MTFVESYSYLGACCSFNYNPKAEESEEFFKSNMFGMNGGLSVIGTGIFVTPSLPFNTLKFFKINFRSSSS